MTTILREMLDESTGVELMKTEDRFYVFVYTANTTHRQFSYSDMNERGLAQALATYELELGYLYTARLEEQPNDHGQSQHA